MSTIISNVPVPKNDKSTDIIFKIFVGILELGLILTFGYIVYSFLQ